MKIEKLSSWKLKMLSFQHTLAGSCQYNNSFTTWGGVHVLLLGPMDSKKQGPIKQ